MRGELNQINVLFIEDNPDDVELEVYELQSHGFDVTHTVARNRREFLKAIERPDADIIVADYSLPDITGIEAIRICTEREIDVPVILVTGAGNEQIAVDSLREGAIDYILKKNIAGFAARVSRAMDIWADRQAVAAARAEKRRLQQQLFQAQKMESVGRLAGGIAHDFNNILTGLMGCATLGIDSVPKGSETAGYFDTIITASKRASHLVKKLLLFSRKVPLQLSVVNVNALIRENVEFIRRMVEETVLIRLDLSDDLPSLRFDEAQLTQVLINFSVNARDAMKGRGTLDFKTELYHHVAIPSSATEAVAADRYVCISVTDTGCGIDEEKIEKIFEPFYTTKEVGKGTGLGLSVVYSIVTEHGGWIQVDSTRNVGTTFKVFLPVPEGKAIGKTVRSEESSPGTAVPVMAGERKTVLLAEDEDFLRTFSAEMLRRLGYNVLTAKDGEQASSIYKAQGKGIDLVVSDMIMPKKTGIELFQELKSINPDIRFILVTGYCLEETCTHVLRNMAAVLLKPYTPDKIADLVRHALVT